MPLFMESPGDRAFERMMAAVPRGNAKEKDSMDFRDGKHRLAFSEAVRRRDRKDNALMAALYLLTAEPALWQAAKPHVEKNAVCFDAVQLHNSTENAYALLCSAKDLYLGTKHLSLTDLADKDLLQPGIFALLCRAIVIRRFGLKTERM